MEWDNKSVRALSEALSSAYLEIRKTTRTDRANLSAIWNRKLTQMGVTILRPSRPTKKNSEGSLAIMFQELMNSINYRNHLVSEALLVSNPDRPHQYLLVPRDTASKILVLGVL